MDSTKSQAKDNQKVRRRSHSMTPVGKAATTDSGNVSFDLNRNSSEDMQSDFRGSTRTLKQAYNVEQSNPNFRKTSADIISEARTLLLGTSNSGVRLVSTHRPITPREPHRQLYGKTAPPGRPPSAFCLRYLQSEIRNLPALEPIQIPTTEKDLGTTSRSQSMGPRFDSFDLKSQRKLPALPPKVKTPPHHDDLTRSPSNVRGSRKRAGSWTDSKDAEKPLPTDDENGNNLGDISTDRINILSSRKLFTRNFDLLAQSSTETLTKMLKQHSGIKDCTDETVQHINGILLELYKRIRTTHGDYRCSVLGGLYGLVECTSPTILLAVARVVLGLRVTGSNLTGACKLVFKVARNEGNDYLFHETDVPELLVDGLGRASPLDEPEACIYGYGAVRFLTSVSQRHRDSDAMNYNSNDKFWETRSDLPPKPSTAPARDSTTTSQQFRNKRQNSLKQVPIATRLSKHGAVQLMVLHLQMLNESGSAQKLMGPPLHSLFQLSAALRALAGAQQISLEVEHLRVQSARVHIEKQSQCFGETKPEDDFIGLEMACPHLIKAAEISIGELEIQANIVRTLSVLSEDPKCCETLAEFTGKIGMLLGPCRHTFTETPEKLLSVLSRLGYILGNIMARYDKSRIQFYYNDVAMEYLFDALEIYSKLNLGLQNQMGDTVVDVLIKLIRVLANMSVNSEVGNGLGEKSALGDILLHVLNVTNQMKVTANNSEVQELLNATLGALHNLCFYQDKSSATNSQLTDDEYSEGSINMVLVQLGATLCQTLRSGQDPARIEAARVLGNLTRNQKAREAFCKAGGLRTIVQCFGSPEYDLRTSAIGVLVNILGDWENRTPFIELKGQLVLGDMLRRFLSQEDWLVAGIICQAFWNLLIDTNNVINVLGEEKTDELSDTLAEYLDDNSLFCGGNPDPIWEQFAMVATDLLERIQSTLGSPFQSFDYEDTGSDEDDVHIKEMVDD